MGSNMADGDVIWTQRKRNWCRTPFTFTTYTLTADELDVKTGVLRQTFDTTKLFRIVDITIERTLLQRLFGLSTIIIDARDQSSGGQIVLKNVIHGFEVRKELQYAVDAARSVNRVSTREFMDSGDGIDYGRDDADYGESGAYDDGR
ncbi:PH domain-containing protein [Bifidobacterium avesanii]|uniref:PH domain-containing protein n=1 Tax=Bifidobacterium avesanii TaxID=1798157 RepID=A0A7K3TEF0_9BIFI|nr:PH domain-containing protein [Bifidobacterium avesanii]KAB8295406.1 Bacterial PH domain-containing protein [Bifidobacterium avesanii]NEG77412.1 PH domain-containing protein [Bifidobacterium avesanii]